MPLFFVKNDTTVPFLKKNVYFFALFFLKEVGADAGACCFGAGAGAGAALGAGAGAGAGVASASHGAGLWQRGLFSLKMLITSPCS